MATTPYQLELPVPQPSASPRISERELEQMLREAFKAAIEEGDVSSVSREIREKP